jgi:hypothetical protein
MRNGNRKGKRGGGNGGFIDFDQQNDFKKVFDQTLEKLRSVRNISSPTAKIEYISNFMNTLRLEDGLQEADYVTSLMIIALIVIGTDS